jgi:hypothetical protein
MTVSCISTRLRVAVLAAVLVVVSVGVTSARASAYPNSMDALGDSITRAFNTCSFPFCRLPRKLMGHGH